MRRAPSAALPSPATGERHDWQTLKSLFPFIWAYKGRVLFALACLVAAKGANVSVPIIFKHLIDGLTITPEQAFNVVPAALLEMQDKNGVIRAQLMTAIPMLVINILLMYFLAFPGK